MKTHECYIARKNGNTWQNIGYFLQERRSLQRKRDFEVEMFFVLNYSVVLKMYKSFKYFKTGFASNGFEVKNRIELINLLFCLVPMIWLVSISQN